MLFLLLAVTVAIAAFILIHKRKTRQIPTPVNAVPTKEQEEEPPREPEPVTLLQVREECKPLQQEATPGEEEAKPNALQETHPEPAASQEVAEKLPQHEEHFSDSVEPTPPKEEETERKGKEEESGPPAESERGRLEPIKRRGRSRRRQKRQSGERKLRDPKLEIICWKRERQWRLAVEIPEKLLGNASVVVLQNGSGLAQDEHREGCWGLKEGSGRVLVQWNEDALRRKKAIALGKDNYLLFKLSGQYLDQGRHVNAATSGSYVIVVPEGWERFDALSEPASQVSESVSLAGYLAHFCIFPEDGKGKIAFRTTEGTAVVIESKKSRFELVGNRLEDATENLGPLFGGMPPQIRILEGHLWGSIGTVVIGEEGGGRWRAQFSPDPAKKEQDLPPQVATRKGGWYFLRFYDQRDNRLESLDFRFLRELKEIRIAQPCPVPLECGHGPVRTEFLHEPGCSFRTAEERKATIEIEREDGKTIVTVSPDPAYDETRWLVGSNGESPVQVVTLVERLWWGLGEENIAPCVWADKPLNVFRDDFTATSKKALWIRLPRPRWADKVLVGFEQSRADPHPVEVTKREVQITLRSFATSREIENLQQEHLLRIWIERDAGFVEGVIARIPADQPARVEQESHMPEPPGVPIDEVPPRRLLKAFRKAEHRTEQAKFFSRGKRTIRALQRRADFLYRLCLARKKPGKVMRGEQ